MLVVSLLLLFLAKLSFQFMNGLVYTGVSVVTALFRNKNIAVFCTCNDFNTWFAAFAALDYYFNAIDAVVITRQFLRLFLGVSTRASVISMCLPLIVKSITVSLKYNF